MRFVLIVVVAAVVSAAMLLLGIEYQWPRALFHCEGFGCSAMGVVYLIYAAAIVVAFAIGGAVFGPRPKASSGLLTGGVATLAMCAVFGILFVQNQMQIADDWRDYADVCAKHPSLCPEKLTPSPSALP
ncbi:MAG: hypothetical protein KJ634_14355 [Gammaproteobacteria bacterium]|nr:hypothetical protein [Gammaproteobacteria bacterium]MBU1416795.1 hypothetical protein [Gammaproteobacteria bacterium]